MCVISSTIFVCTSCTESEKRKDTSSASTTKEICEETKTPAPYGYADELVGCWVLTDDAGEWGYVMQLVSNGTCIRAIHENHLSGEWVRNWEITEYNWYFDNNGFAIFDTNVFYNYKIIDENTLILEDYSSYSDETYSNTYTYKRYEGTITDYMMYYEETMNKNHE